jgi:hypothetical protein
MVIVGWSGQVAPFDTPFGHSGCLPAAAWTRSLRCQDGTPLDCAEDGLRYAASLCSLATWDAILESKGAKGEGPFPEDGPSNIGVRVAGLVPALPA